MKDAVGAKLFAKGEQLGVLARRTCQTQHIQCIKVQSCGCCDCAKEPKGQLLPFHLGGKVSDLSSCKPIPIGLSLLCRLGYKLSAARFVLIRSIRKKPR